LIKDAKGTVTFFVLLKGFSHHDSTEGHLHYPSLSPVFAAAIKKALPSGVPVVEFDRHINDAAFADAIVEVDRKSKRTKQSMASTFTAHCYASTSRALACTQPCAVTPTSD
jgi:uncharacterized protein (UPF0261 family)